MSIKGLTDKEVKESERSLVPMRFQIQNLRRFGRSLKRRFGIR